MVSWRQVAAVPNVGLWLILEDEDDHLQNCVSNLADIYKTFKFKPHVTWIPNISKEYYDNSTLIVNSTWQALLEGNWSNVSFDGVESQRGVWSLDVYLVVKPDDEFVNTGNAILSAELDLPKGFARQVKKAHVSLLYGEGGHSSEEQWAAQQYVRENCTVAMLSEYQPHSVATVNTSGGYKDLGDWEILYEFHV